MVPRGRVPEPEELDPDAPYLSDQWVMGYLAYLYPGAWLPESLEQIRHSARPWFELTWSGNGRDDDLVTMDAWRRRVRALGSRKWPALAPLLLHALVSRDRRRLLRALRHGCAPLCVERRVSSHSRMVFHRT